MSAVELLRKVEALPARERKRFLLALLKLEGKPSDANRKGRRVKWPDMLIPFTPAHRAFSMEFSGQRPTTGVNGISIWPDIEARARRIFGERVFPNLVVLERQEEAV